MARRRAKRYEIWDSLVVIINVWYTFDLLVFKVNLRSFSAFVSKMVCNSKMAGWRAKWNEILDSLVRCIWGSFDLLVFKAILGSFGALGSK